MHSLPHVDKLIKKKTILIIEGHNAPINLG